MGTCCCKEEEIDFDSEVELSHFHLLRSVGKGAFGKVRVVQHKHSKILYALKYINKAKCIKMRAVENIIQERRLLEEIDYPLVCNLRYAFQDDENLFMVLDLMLGGDLRFHLERQGNMKEEVVKFYIAEVSLGLHYLHLRKIVHRDLKPDNVLLDEKGHAHLTDFNIAVHFNERKPLMSVAGSMAYMGYFDSVDWWSLGVVMYELLFSKRPFRGKTNHQLTQAILHEPLTFPENANGSVSEECLDCIRRFCERDIKKRLGCGPNGLEDIKKHPWFKDIEWGKLDTKEAKPPFVPDSKRANFDATHELEELLLEDNPLKAKKRANPNQDLSELSKEMRMMEEKFLVYDFSKMRRRSYNNHNLNNGMQEKRSSQIIRRKSGSRSSSSSTTVERLNTDSSTIMNFNIDTNAALLPIRPPSSAKSHGLQGSDLSGYVDEQKEKNRGDWLNERPSSPQNRDSRRTSGFGLGTMPSSGKTSLIMTSNESDFSTKPYPVGRVSPSSSIIIDINKQNLPGFSSTTPANSSSLSPPPRVQPPVQTKYNSTSPSSSRPSSPNLHPARSPSPQLVSSNTSSLIVSPPELELISSQNVTPLPSKIPLSQPPSTFSTIKSTSTLMNPINPSSSLSTDSYNQSASSIRVRSLSPPSTNKRPTIPMEPSPTSNSRVWSSSELGEGNHTASTSRNSAGSGFSSENSNDGGVGGGLSARGHFRNASDVSTGSGALSAVGVPAGL
ncbi:4047_t:CDS:2 [Funneliformis caledonium]|uniref:4047_t:CDS:1 n=1 Tax=Funneliformis caledonium TaxID=1117310 RepID=A0A9N9H572_9GLOM|nr:4047_t:CDS:2 [Funneliformis caledonium]